MKATGLGQQRQHQGSGVFPQADQCHNHAAKVSGKRRNPGAIWAHGQTGRHNSNPIKPAQKGQIMFQNDISRLVATPVFAANRTAMPLGTGLLASTMIETSKGWQRAESLRFGDSLYTVDGGLAPVLGLDRQWIAPQPDLHTVHVPGGTLDNDDDLLLLSGQMLLLDTMGDKMLPDAALVLIPATALIGWRGCSRQALSHRTEVITPLFAAEEIVYANAGTMLRCPSIAEGAHAAIRTDFTRLDLRQAWALLARLDGGPSGGHAMRQVA
jgi:Hint domain